MKADRGSRGLPILWLQSVWKLWSYMQTDTATPNIVVPTTLCVVASVLQWCPNRCKNSQQHTTIWKRVCKWTQHVASNIKLITDRWAWALVPTKLVEPGNALTWGGGISLVLEKGGVSEQPQAPSCSSCMKKQDNTLTNGMQQPVRVTPLTAVHAQDNTVLGLAAMSKALQITNGTCKRNDTGCQACWLEMPTRALEGVRI